MVIGHMDLTWRDISGEASQGAAAGQVPEGRHVRPLAIGAILCVFLAAGKVSGDAPPPSAVAWPAAGG